MVNGSLILSIFLESLKMAVVKPLLKKNKIDPTELNYRHISDLNFIGNVIESGVLT